uniref:Uncharacterized protein n=1 Tax=Setaria viridis TaxID=4556 RepID=A0A4U6U855_SETVI|nr:hypothetical protein SEVIR_6G225350v2 [Setaria viridis]
MCFSKTLLTKVFVLCLFSLFSKNPIQQETP